MIGMANAVDHGITHHNIGMRHVNLQAQNMLAIFVFTITHLTKDRQIVIRGAFTIRTIFSSLTKVAAISVNVVSTLTINIRFAILNQDFCKLIEAIEVITCVIQMRTPIKAQPFHCIQNTIRVLDIFLNGVGVV